MFSVYVFGCKYFVHCFKIEMALSKKLFLHKYFNTIFIVFIFIKSFSYSYYIDVKSDRNKSKDNACSLSSFLYYILHEYSIIKIFK